VFDAIVKIDSSSCEHSLTSGIGIYGSAHPIIKNCQINNITSTPISMSLFSNPTFTQNNTALNVGFMALGVVPETYSVNATVQKRDFAGYTNMTYMFYPRGYVPYVINSGTVITIPAGVVIKGEQGINVNGALVINGTPTERVVFTDTKDDQYGRPGDTNGDGSATQPSITSNDYPKISFSDISDDSLSVLRNVVFRYNLHGINLDQASPQITNCVFDNDDWGVRLNGVSKPSVDSCTFHNLTYAPIRTSLVSYPRSTMNNVISGKTYRGIGILDETLVQDVTLTKRSFAGVNNIPYLFNTYVIGTGAVLTVNPGVVLKFFGGGTLTVKKGLIAEGGSTPDSTIVFTDMRDDFYGGDTNADSNATTVGGYSPGTWKGIIFSDESLDPYCRLTHCVIRDAQQYCPGWYCEDATAITTHSASPTITYCTISNNHYGIVTNGASNPKINYCDIFQNTIFGVRNADRSFNFDARYNWWGNNSGPTHSGNPSGTGDIVSDSVNYSSFRTTGALQPIAGDVSLNGIVQAFDASKILKFVVDSVSNPLSTVQKKAADVSGEMGVTSYDASLILQYVVGNIVHFPIESNSMTEPVVFPKVTASSIEIGTGIINKGNSVSVPIRVQGMHSFASADIRLAFDSKVIVPTEVTATSTVLGAIVSSNILGNEFVIALASPKFVDIEGDLVTVTFTIQNGNRTGSKTPINFSQVLINEQDYLFSARPGEIVLGTTPKEFVLEQNYPNPFNPTTAIRFQLPDDGIQARVEVFNMLGELVSTVSDEMRNAGTYTVQWNGVDNSGLSVSSGFYYYRLTATGNSNFTDVKKMLLLK